MSKDQEVELKLTEDRITKLECPAGKKDVLVFDEVQRGLAVRITSSGGKTYLAQYTFAGAKRRIPLGSCDAISLAAAREGRRRRPSSATSPRAATRQLIARMRRSGRTGKAAHDALTLEALLEQWDA